MPLFSPKALQFLRQLKRNNRREWFIERKPVFDEHVWEPMKNFVEEVDVMLGSLAPEFTGSPKRSIFRIYRDTRFSKDKTPYKTHVGCWFTHVNAGYGEGSETHGAGAGFYFHLEPGASFIGGGIWMPPRPTLLSIRERIASDPASFAATLGGRAFTRRFGTLSDEKTLVRVPRPWTADHPAAHWLRHVSFTASAPLTDAQVVSPTLLRLVEKDFSLLLPFVRWLQGGRKGSAESRRAGA